MATAPTCPALPTRPPTVMWVIACPPILAASLLPLPHLWGGVAAASALAP